MYSHKFEIEKVSFFIFSLAIIFVISTDPVSAQLKDNNIPTLKCVIGDIEYNMKPIKFANNDKEETLNQLTLPDDVKPEFNIGIGETMYMEFSDEPSVVNVFLIDYDGDIPQSILQKTIDNNNAIISGPEGTRNLEVRAIYPNGEYVSYSALVDVGEYTHEYDQHINHSEEYSEH